MKATHLSVLIVLAAALTVGCAPKEMVVDIPKLDGIAVDGDAADWCDDGYRVSWLTHMRSGGDDLAGPAEFDPTFRLGWTDEGLVVLAMVHDDAFATAADDESLWANKADVVVLYVIPERGGEEFTRIAVAPNAGIVISKMYVESALPRVLVSVDAKLTDREEQPSPYRAVDLAGRATDVRAARYDVKRVEDPYVLEVLVPWSVVNVPGRMGHEFGLQVGFVDSDPTKDGGLSQGGAMWHPELGTTADTTRSHPVRLSRRAGDPELAGISEDGYRTNRDYYVDVEGATEVIGKAIELRARGKVVGKAVLEAGESGWAFASPQFRTRPWRQTFDEVDVFVDGRSIGTVTLPEAKRRCAEMLVHHEMRPDGATFTGPQFPRFDFEEPETIEGIIGPYEVTATYYDADYNEVTTAQRQGRYGAIVEVTPRSGRQFKRFVTLYRTAGQPDEDQWRAWRHSSAVTVTLPPWMGIDEKTAAVHSDMLEDFARGQLHDGLERYQRSAVMLAGLFEASAEANVDPDDTYSDPRQRDRAWWLGLKRKLYGWDKRWPEPFVCPRPIDGKRATVVREGTLAEAGMKPDAPEKIDVLLAKWAGDTDESFAVCVVRRGVIVLHKAYGLRDGEPMTLTTRSWMASTTKMLSGSLIMMLVDQGMMDLDDPIQDYLPALAGLETNEPLTIRRLYNHTDDFDWHMGHDVNDMEERIAVLLGRLNVGGQYRYNGTGMELVCKALEAISGETLPQFFKSHLLDPLGCDNTNVGSASHDAHSVPLDMARIAQMLLNKGAYGNMRFISEKTFERMLPLPVMVEGGPSSIEYGVGTTWVQIPGLSKESFTHGAASAATTWIDPTNELIIIMTRNDAGKNFHRYHMQFIQAVIDGMIDPAPAEGETTDE